MTATNSTVAANWIALDTNWDPALANNMACILTWQETITAGSILNDIESAISDVEEVAGVVADVVTVIGAVAP